MKVSFSLANNKAKTVAAATGTAPPLKQPAAFGALDDEPIDAAPTVGTGFSQGNKVYVAQNAASTSRTKRKMEAEMKVDATVYEYDAVWDQMQEAKQKKKLAKEAEQKERKVCTDINLHSQCSVS